MKYKLIDLQVAGTFDKVTFDSKEDIRNSLIDYHSNDCEKESLEKMTLDELLEFGEWEIEEVK